MQASPNAPGSKNRAPLELTDTLSDTAVTMSEGNAGAATVIGQVLQNDPEKGLLDLLRINDMNMRGPQIWVAYKDHCGQDLEQFLNAVRSHDEAMIKTVNDQCAGSGEEAVVPPKPGLPELEKNLF